MAIKQLMIVLLIPLCLFCMPKSEKKETREQTSIDIARPCFFSISASQIKSGQKLTLQLAPAFNWKNLEKVEVLGQTLSEAQPLLTLSPSASGAIKAVAFFKDSRRKTCSQALIVKSLEKDVFCSLSSSSNPVSDADDDVMLSLSVGGLDANNAISSSIQGYDLKSSQGGQRRFRLKETTRFLGKVELADQSEILCSVEIEYRSNHFCKTKITSEDLSTLEKLNSPLKKEYQSRLASLRKQVITIGSEKVPIFRSLYLYSTQEDACKVHELSKFECIDHGILAAPNSSSFKIGSLTLDNKKYDYLVLKPYISYEVYRNSGQNEAFLYQAIDESIGQLPVEICACSQPPSRSNAFKSADAAFSAPIMPEFAMILIENTNSSEHLKVIGEQINSIKNEQHVISQKNVEPKNGEIRPICENNWNIQT